MKFTSRSRAIHWSIDVPMLRFACVPSGRMKLFSGLVLGPLTSFPVAGSTTR